MKSHFVLSSWSKKSFVLFLKGKNSFLRTLVLGFTVISYKYRRKEGTSLRFCISKEPKSIYSSPLRNFPWPHLSHMFFYQQVLIFRAMLCADWLRLVLLNQSPQ